MPHVSVVRRPLDDEDVIEQRVTDKQGTKYYEW